MNLNNKISISTINRGLVHLKAQANGDHEASKLSLEKELTSYPSLLRFIGKLFNIKVLQDKYEKIDNFKKAIAPALINALKELDANTSMLGFDIGKIHIRIYESDGKLGCEIYSPVYKGSNAVNVDTLTISGTLLELRDAISG